MPEAELRSHGELSHDEWAAISEAVSNFEEMWERTNTPEIEPLLPPAGSPLRLRVLIELVRVDQEHRWERGDRRQVEDYARDWPELTARPRALAELLQAEC